MPRSGTICWQFSHSPHRSCGMNTFRRCTRRQCHTATGWTRAFVTLWDRLRTGWLPPARLSERPLLRRIHIRLGLGQGLRRSRSGLLPQGCGWQVPFTLFRDSRLLARDTTTREALVQALLRWCRKEQLSSLHLLFGSDDDLDACTKTGLMLRHTCSSTGQNVPPRSALTCPRCTCRCETHQLFRPSQPAQAGWSAGVSRLGGAFRLGNGPAAKPTLPSTHIEALTIFWLR